MAKPQHFPEVYDLVDKELTIRWPGLPELRMSPPWLTHTMRFESGGFDGTFGLEGGPPEHVFEIQAMPEWLERPTRSGYQVTGRKRAVAWRRLRPLAVPNTIRQYREGALVLGRLIVADYPVRFEFAARGWDEWLAETELEHSEVTEIVRWAASGARGADMLGYNDDGSVYYFKSLNIHPAIQGQHAGAALIGYAAQMLPRAFLNLAVMLCNPMPSWFLPEQRRDAPVPQAQARRLAAYYESMGFRIWKPRRRRAPGAPIGMYAYIGEGFLQFRREADAELERDQAEWEAANPEEAAKGRAEMAKWDAENSGNATARLH